jgi:LPXTG-motif cell wall-anchored protein
VKEPVLSAEVTPAEKAEDLIQEPVAAIAPEHFEIAEVTPAETPAPEPVVEAPAPEPAPVAAAAVEELPKTGSEIPLLALLGAGSLALGGLLRRIRAR